MTRERGSPVQGSGKGRGRMPIAALLPRDLVEALSLEPPYRARQIMSWLRRGVTDFHDMTSLPARERERLARTALVWTSQVETVLAEMGTGGSRSDCTEKYRIVLQDGTAVESVFVAGGTACLSTQVGCGMKCAFCATGRLGLSRNLQAHEIVEQFLHLRSRHRVQRVVLMGMGEPFANWPETRRAVEVICSPEGHGLSARKLTVSTCGLPAGIRMLADDPLPLRLSVSLVTADQDVRARLMPVARRYPVARLRRALEVYQQRGGKRVTLEMVLLRDLTDRIADAEALLLFVRGLRVMVNLIPWNEVPDMAFSPPTRVALGRYRRVLEAHGVPVTLRSSKGADLRAACGQLGSTGTVSSESRETTPAASLLVPGSLPSL